MDEQLRDLQAQVPAFLAAVGGVGAIDGQGGDDLAAGEPLTPPQVLCLAESMCTPVSGPYIYCSAALTTAGTMINVTCDRVTCVSIPA